MIKISDVETFGFRKAICSMRNPYESHGRSDSKSCKEMPECYQCIKWKHCPFEGDSSNGFSIGKADMELAKKLIKAGPEHRKFLRMIHVQCDVTAPRYFWQEMSTYKHVEANSSSTMHLITKRHLTAHDFSTKYPDSPSYAMREIINLLNSMIDECNSDRWNADQKETFFMSIKEHLPESFNQLRTLDTNYEALLSIHHQRKNHRLKEWREFCQWVESLPYMDEFLAAANGQQMPSK